MEPRLELFDFVDLHNGRAMNAQNLLGIELGLETADGLAQQVTPGAVVNADVVAFRLDTINIADIEEKDAARSLHHQALDIASARFQLFEQRHDVLVASIEF